MRKVLLILSMAFLSCSFTKNFVKRKHDKFVAVVNYILNNKLNQLTRENIKDESIKNLMKELDIDVAVDGNQGHQYSNEPKDSVIVFVNHGAYFFGKYKRVFYDYSKTPRQFKDTTIKHNDYVFKKVSDRFYISSEKTDR